MIKPKYDIDETVYYEDANNKVTKVKVVYFIEIHKKTVYYRVKGSNLSKLVKEEYLFRQWECKGLIYFIKKLFR